MADRLNCIQMNIPVDFEWMEPWCPIDDPSVASRLLAELEKETSPSHPAFRKAIKALARRCDCDDVLFLMDDAEHPLAVIHLTWRGSIEPDPIWPGTSFFTDWNDWLKRGFEE